MITVDEIYVGMPVTMSICGDSYPYEVIDIKGHRVTLREVEPVEMSDWTEGCYTQKYKSRPNGETVVVTDRGTHGWHKEGDYRSPSYGWCYRVHFGRAVYNRDPSF